MTVSRPRARARTAADAWVTKSSLRLSRRSATSPPKEPASSMGRNWRARTMPTSRPRAVEHGEDQKGLGHRLHPGARDRDDLAGEVQAVVADRQGRERLAAGGAHRAHSVVHQVFEHGGQGTHRRLLLGLEGGQGAGQEGVLEEADALERSPALGGQAHPAHPAVERRRADGPPGRPPPSRRRAGSWSGAAPARPRPARPGSGSRAATPSPGPRTGRARDRRGTAGGDADAAG